MTVAAVGLGRTVLWKISPARAGVRCPEPGGCTLRGGPRERVAARVPLEAGEVPKMRTPFHNQCGSSEAEYKKLLREGEDAANASDFDDNAEEHPNVNNAGKPRTEGIGRP